jgi:hypothetical protein
MYPFRNILYYVQILILKKKPFNTENKKKIIYFEIVEISLSNIIPKNNIITEANNSCIIE